MNVHFDQLGKVGRLGNALYQLAATAGIANILGVEPRFNSDWIHRPYFSVPDHLFTDDFTDSVAAHKAHPARHIDERARVYLQDWNLFADILPTIREWLTPSDKALAIMEADPEVAEFSLLPRPVLSIHVRRGDNAPGGDPATPDKHLYHPMPPVSYYLSAVHPMYAYEPASIALFSDDIDWCKDALPFGDFYRHGVGRPKEHEPDYLTAPVLDWIDWQLQTRCDRHICSNSTFGIMAAIIAGDDAIVPWPIYGPKLSFIRAELMFPATWTRIDTGASRAARP